jgi:hypothetical protein
LPATDAFALKVRSAIEDRFDEYDRDSAHAKKIFRHLQPNAKRSTRKPAARKPAARSRTRRNPDWASLTDAELNAELGRMDDAIEALEAKWDLYQHGYSAGLRKEAPKVQAEIMKMFEARAPIEEERNLRAAARRRGALANDFASAGRAGDTQSARTALLEYKSYLPRRNGGRGR